MHNNPGVLDLDIRKLAGPFKSYCCLLVSFDGQSFLIQLGLVFIFVYSIEKNLKFH